MADYNTVPLGQAGTGAAFTLGENRALPIFQQQIEKGITQRELEAQKIAKSYRDNLLAASDGKLFAKELGALEQKHVEQGVEYRRQGFDIYNPDPNNAYQMKAYQQYMADRRQIQNLQSYRKGIEDDFNKGAELLSKEVEGVYDPEIVAERNRLVSEGSLVDLYNKGERLPALQKRFNASTALTGIKAPTVKEVQVVNGLRETKEYVDEKEARKTVLSTILSSPAGQSHLAKITKGIPLQELEALPNKLDDIKNRVNEEYAGYPDGLAYLAEKGIKVDTPQYEEFITKQAKQLYDAKRELNNLVDNGVNKISQGIKRVNDVRPDFTVRDQQIQEENRLRSIRSDQRAEIKFQERNDKKSSEPNTPELQRQIDIEEMINGVPGSGERIGAIMAGRGGYQGKLGIEDKGTTITFTIPKRVVTTESITTDQYGDEVTKPKTTVTPARKITIRKNNESDKIRFNEILNDITGEKISYRSYKTGNPSGKVSKTTVTKPKATSVTTPKFKGVPKGGF